MISDLHMHQESLRPPPVGVCSDDSQQAITVRHLMRAIDSLPLEIRTSILGRYCRFCGKVTSNMPIGSCLCHDECMDGVHP